MEAARGNQGAVEGPPSFARQWSAFPGQCPPVVRLLFLCSVFARQFVFPVPCPPVVRLPCTLPTSSPPSQDPAHQLSAFPGLCPPVVRLLFLSSVFARQLSAFPGPCPPVVRIPWNLPASCPPSLHPACQLSAFPRTCPGFGCGASPASIYSCCPWCSRPSQPSLLQPCCRRPPQLGWRSKRI